MLLTAVFATGCSPNMFAFGFGAATAEIRLSSLEGIVVMVIRPQSEWRNGRFKALGCTELCLNLSSIVYVRSSVLRMNGNRVYVFADCVQPHYAGK